MNFNQGGDEKACVAHTALRIDGGFYQSLPTRAAPPSTLNSMAGHPQPYDAQKASTRARLFIAIPILCIPVLVGILVGWYLRIRDFENGGGDTAFQGRNIYLQANLIDINPLSATMSLDWFIVGDSACSPESSDTTGCTGVNLYFDTNTLNALTENEVAGTNNRPTVPIFAYNATSLYHDDGRANIAAFRTPIALMYPDHKSSSMQDYPFDEYYAQFFIYAFENDTDAKVGVGIRRTRGIAVGFNVKSIQNPLLRDAKGVIENEIIITRGVLVKAYAVVVVAAIWIITLIFLLATLSSIIFGFQQRENVLVIPVACLFAFTQLRSSMPGAPNGFGAMIDYVGMLPCLAIITVSAALTLGSLVLSDPTMNRITIFDRIWLKFNSRK